MILCIADAITYKKNGKHMKKDFLYKAAEMLFNRFAKKDAKQKWLSAQVKGNLERLYPFSGKEKIREYYIQKIRFSLLLCLIGVILTGGMLLAEILQPVVKENKICRQGFQGNMREVPVKVTVGENMQHELILQIGERIYERKQIEKLYEEALDKLEGAILGENEGLERVETDLVLVKELPGYPFRIEWESQNYRLIDAEGKLQKAPVSEEGEQVGLRGIFTYHDFRAEYLIYIHIYPRTLTKEEEEKEKLLRAVNEVERHSRESEVLLLPAELEGKKLVWSSGGNENLLIILFFTVCGAGTAYFLKDEDLKKEVKERERQMYLGYPEVVSKLSIYLGAGMTIRTAWEKICADYEKRDANAVKNPVYEEMKITCQEMKSGISEISAYERFGKRCGIQIYGKFSTLLIQNLRKGSTRLGALFKEESQMAFEERKNAARKAGEEAGTKLLLPMMMMLCVVMLMILLPAFMTF